MTDAKDAALDKAIEAFHKAWPGFRKWFASTDLAEIPPEPFEAAIAAYLAALPKGELAERLDQFAENANCPPGTGGGPVMEKPEDAALEKAAEAIDPKAFCGTQQEVHMYCSPSSVEFVQGIARAKAQAAIAAYLAALPKGELAERLLARADSYEQSGPSAQHTAALLREAAAMLSVPEGWRTIDDAPDDGERVWVFGGQYKEPTLKEADGQWWRFNAKKGDGLAPTHWMPFRPPAPPARPDQFAENANCPPGT